MAYFNNLTVGGTTRFLQDVKWPGLKSSVDELNYLHTEEIEKDGWIVPAASEFFNLDGDWWLFGNNGPLGLKVGNTYTITWTNLGNPEPITEEVVAINGSDLDDYTPSGSVVLKGVNTDFIIYDKLDFNSDGAAIVGTKYYWTPIEDECLALISGVKEDGTRFTHIESNPNQIPQQNLKGAIQELTNPTPVLEVSLPSIRLYPSKYVGEGYCPIHLGLIPGQDYIVAIQPIDGDYSEMGIIPCTLMDVPDIYGEIKQIPVLEADGTVLVADNVAPYGAYGAETEFIVASPEPKGGHIIHSYLTYPDYFEYTEITGPGLSYPISYCPVLTGSILGEAGSLRGLGMQGHEVQAALDNQVGRSGEGSYSEIFNLYEDSKYNPINKATGEYSHAEGKNTNAGGRAAHAEGCGSVALGDHSHAENSGNAYGSDSHAENEAYAYGTCSHAEGSYDTETHGLYSHAEGDGACAVGEGSHSEGYGSSSQVYYFTGTGNSKVYTCGRIAYFGLQVGEVLSYNDTYAIITAIDTTASTVTFNKTLSSTDLSDAIFIRHRGVSAGDHAHSEGYLCTASGYHSHAGGYYTIANIASSYAIGEYNKVLASDDQFVIGNGTSSARSNAFRVNNKGATYGLSAFNSSGADYAEFVYPWYDNNMDNEDRIGYFTTFKDGKLYKATSKDIILGITSGNPSIVGNADEDYYWRYERDEFNRIIFEDVEEEIQKVDENGNLVLDEDGNPIMEKTGNIIKNGRMKLSENYDPTLQGSYVERKDRAECDYVGRLGFLPTIDDGTCIPGQYCKCNDDGIATLATPEDVATNRFTFIVLERVSDNVIKIKL